MEWLRRNVLDGKEEEEMLSESQHLPGSGPVGNKQLSVWGTWEDLLLAGALVRHGTSNWSTVSGELQARALVLKVSPTLFSEEACKCRFLTLNGRFASCATSSRNDDLKNPIRWFEELRKIRVTYLKRELEHYEDSIGLLQRKLKSLKAERAQTTYHQGEKQAADNGISDQNSRKRRVDDAGKGGKTFETSPVGDNICLPGTAEFPKGFLDTDLIPGFPKAASEQPECSDDRGKHCKGTVKIAACSQQAAPKDWSEQSTLTGGSDSHASLESLNDHRKYVCVVADGAQSFDVLGVRDLPLEEQTNPGSPGAGVQNCGTLTSTRYRPGKPAGTEVSEKQEENLSIADDSTAEVQSESVGKGREIGGPVKVRDEYRRFGTVESNSQEDHTHVGVAHCPPRSLIEGSASGCVDRADDIGQRAVGVGAEPRIAEGLERTVAGANAMDLLRLAYGSAQDATPVCTPEPQPHVESEAVLDLESVPPRNNGPSNSTSLVTSPADELTSATGKARESDPNLGRADGDCRTAGHLQEEHDNSVPKLQISEDLSNAETLSLPSNVAETQLSSNGNGNILEPQVDTPNDNPITMEESEVIPCESLLKSQSMIERVEEAVCEADAVIDTSESSRPLQSSSLHSQHEEDTRFGSLPVQVPNTEKMPVTIPGQCVSGQVAGFVQGHEPVLKQSPSTDKSFDNEIESASSHDKTRSYGVAAGSPGCEGKPERMIDEPSKRANDVAVEELKPDGATILVGTGSATPSVDVETKIVAMNVSEDDGLLRDLMMLKPTKLSNLRKRQMLCNGGNNTGNCRNHTFVKEDKQNSLDESAVKRLKSQDVKENVTYPKKEVSEANSNSTSINEESPPLKPRQFKLRSGRVKGLVKNSERAIASASKGPHTGVPMASETGVKNDCVSQILPNQSACPRLNQIGRSEGDVTGNDTESQDRTSLNSEITEGNLEKEAQEYGKGQLEKTAEIATYDANDERSPPLKRSRTDIKSLPLLESLHVIQAQRFAPLFKRRQESQENDRYTCLIRRHMDLNTVTSQLDQGMYTAGTEFFRDLLLIFNNALVFYSRDSQEYGAARVLRECVMKEMEKSLQTEAPPKLSGRKTRKREAKKVGEELNAPAAASSEGKRWGSLRSSSSDHVGSAASPDGGINTRAADVGVERSSSVNKDGEVDNSQQQPPKGLEVEKKERDSKDVSISYTRSKSRAKVQQSTDDGRTEKISVQKEKNGRSLDDTSGLRVGISARKESQGLKRSAQNSLKVREEAPKNDDSESSSKAAKSVSRKQSAATTEELTRKTSGGRPPRNSQSNHPVSKGNQLSFQSQKRGRT